jgi:hypothetical protein
VRQKLNFLKKKGFTFLHNCDNMRIDGGVDNESKKLGDSGFKTGSKK